MKKQFQFSKECIRLFRLIALLLALSIYYFSLVGCKEVTVQDENGNISRCLVLSPKPGATFKDGRNHIYTIIKSN